ncbi:hypothetical protein [Raoultella terrigena]|uniref:hypothetical protein n=1 Tax=Raoultella terrigena TaxID=577 RepID=UPI001652B4B7|nr:hypothetical protein [Raoultella terrigena]
MANEIEFKFGDYAIIEQKRHGVSNEMFLYKVVDLLRSNTWVDVPVQAPATETIHDEMEDVCWCICCGISETEVRKYRVKDMQRSNLSPDGGEVTALALTQEKCRQITNCPAGIDLQDYLRQLAAENAGLKGALTGSAYINFIKANGWNASASTVNGKFVNFADPEVDFGSMVFAHAKKLVDDIKTPATDAYLAGIKADGVEEFAKSRRELAKETISKIMPLALEAEAMRAEDFAKQLRDGAK